jgi:hypothetical protein
MWSVDKTSVEIAEVIEGCAKKIRKKGVKPRVKIAAPDIVANHMRYDDAALARNTHLLTAAQYSVSGLSDDEMRWLYEQQLVKSTAGGREFYDALIGGARFELCSYCQYGHADTLDHYVPQSKVGGLAIEPLNLVPACEKCNHKLQDYVAMGRSDQMFHPYFESVESRWLYAEVLEADPVAIKFFVDTDSALDQMTQDRVNNQFETLGLELMYGAISGRDVAEASEAIRGVPRSERDIDAEGEEVTPIPDVRTIQKTSLLSASSVLSETARIAFAVDPNSRRGAVYEALAANTWFCTEGYSQ